MSLDLANSEVDLADFEFWPNLDSLPLGKCTVLIPSNPKIIR